MSLHSLRKLKLLSQRQSYIATDGESVSKSWCRAPSGTHDQIFSYYYLTVTVLFLWGALSDERTGLSFVYAAGNTKHGLTRVKDTTYTRPYFTVSDLRLSISSPPTTPRVTAELFDPASTRVCPFLDKDKVTLRPTASQSVSLGVELHLGLMTRYLLLFDSTVLLLWAPSLTRGRFCLLYMQLALASAVFLGSESLGTLATLWPSTLEYCYVGCSPHIGVLCLYGRGR
jgi:hypothetical protein